MPGFKAKILAASASSICRYCNQLLLIYCSKFKTHSCRNHQYISCTYIPILWRHYICTWAAVHLTYPFNFKCLLKATLRSHWEDNHRRNFGGGGVRTPTFGSGRTDPHFISTPSQKFCLVPHFSHQSFATEDSNTKWAAISFRHKLQMRGNW